MKYLLDTNTCVYLLNGNPVLKKKAKKIGVYSKHFQRIEGLKIENWLSGKK